MIKIKVFSLKQIFVLLTVAVIVISCKKETIEIKKENKECVTKAEAERVANIFANSNTTGLKMRKSGSFEMKSIDKIYVISDNNEPSIYIVNFKPQGFVIISATKREIPILGFSESSYIDLEYESLGFQEWIKLRKEKIRALKKDCVVLPSDLNDIWEAYIPQHEPNTGGEDPIYDPDLDPTNSNYLAARTIVKGPLLTTVWDQTHGFNTLLTPIDGILPPAGCVATATAQVMKYYKFPSTYNWAAMPDSNATLETARLLKDIGIAVEMDYGVGASYSNIYKAQTALVSTFGYSSTANIVLYNYNTVVSEINNKRPVIFNGYTSSTGGYGHAWVCDGYLIDEYFRNQSGTVTSHTEYLHMNWGYFYGSGNGYFATGNFKVTYSDGTTLNFKYNNNCVVSIKPGIATKSIE